MRTPPDATLTFHHRCRNCGSQLETTKESRLKPAQYVRSGATLRTHLEGEELGDAMHDCGDGLLGIAPLVAVSWEPLAPLPPSPEDK